MERWSSHTRMLAMRYLRVHLSQFGISFSSPGVQHFQNKFRAFAQSGLHINLCAVRLHYLIHNGQSQAGAAFKLRLKRLKNLLSKLERDARPGVTNADAQKIT